MSLFSSKAILHVDADSFFVSCEIARQPQLKGLAVVTGQERGIVSALSYEAKALGIKRGEPIYQIRQRHPQVKVIASDYETYSLYSLKISGILRRYSLAVEDYSIDECFVDLSGLSTDYKSLLKEIKQSLELELGFTCSLGLASTKVLAKIASSANKPNGLVIIDNKNIDQHLSDLPVAKIWGIGPQTSKRLNLLGVKTALDFKNKPLAWLKANLHKPQIEIWQELHGISIYPLITETRTNYQSVAKTKTFSPPSSDLDFVLSELSQNLEQACARLRRYNLLANKLSFFLKTQSFNYYKYELKLSSATNNPLVLLALVSRYINKVYQVNTLYRASGVTLSALVPLLADKQLDLFTDLVKQKKQASLLKSYDSICARYGSESIFLASSLASLNRNKTTSNNSDLLPPDRQRKNFPLPFLGELN